MRSKDVAKLPLLKPEVIRDQDSSNPIAIQFENVTKEYRLYSNDVKRLLGAFFGNVSYKPVRASDDLSFTINRGDSVAFIGNNGAGKSTALKMINGVTFPDTGRITVHGRVSALLNLRAGFDPKLTGRENLRFRGMLWGLSDEEMDKLEPQMIKFAELGDYIDQPLRTYSSGMRARLGFSFASTIKPDILIVDEALAVGDKNFKKKCLKRVRQIVSRDGVTVLFVTHSAASAKRFCKKGIVLDHGHVLYQGDIDDALEFYEEMNV